MWKVPEISNRVTANIEAARPVFVARRSNREAVKIRAVLSVLSALQLYMT
jgi:hypothetical protein